MGQVVWDVGCQLASPPMVGCMLAVVVGLTPPVRDQLFAPGGSLLMVQVGQQHCGQSQGVAPHTCLLLLRGSTQSPPMSLPPPTIHHKEDTCRD